MKKIYRKLAYLLLIGVALVVVSGCDFIKACSPESVIDELAKAGEITLTNEEDNSVAGTVRFTADGVFTYTPPEDTNKTVIYLPTQSFDPTSLRTLEKSNDGEFSDFGVASVDGPFVVNADGLTTYDINDDERSVTINFIMASYANKHLQLTPVFIFADVSRVYVETYTFNTQPADGNTTADYLKYDVLKNSLSHKEIFKVNFGKKPETAFTFDAYMLDLANATDPHYSFEYDPTYSMSYIGEVKEGQKPDDTEEATGTTTPPTTP